MSHSEVLEAPSARHTRAALARLRERLAGLVGRAPGKVRAKLLIAFLAIVTLLVVVGALGLRDLGQANARVEHLAALQFRVGQYEGLAAAAAALQQSVNARDSGDATQSTYTGDSTLSGSGEFWRLADLQVTDVASQVELQSDLPLFKFTPPPADLPSIRQIQRDYAAISTRMAR